MPRAIPMTKQKRNQTLANLLKTHRVNGRVWEKGKCRVQLVHRKSGKPRIFTIKVR